MARRRSNDPAASAKYRRREEIALGRLQTIGVTVEPGRSAQATLKALKASGMSDVYERTRQAYQVQVPTYRVGNAAGVGGRRRELPVRRPMAGGEYISARTAGALDFVFTDLGNSDVALRITFDGEPQFISAKTVPELDSFDAGAGELAGESGRGTMPLGADVQIYSGHPDGIPASVIADLIRGYGSVPDAMYALWLMVAARYQ